MKVIMHLIANKILVWYTYKEYWIVYNTETGILSPMTTFYGLLTIIKYNAFSAQTIFISFSFHSQYPHLWSI